MPLEVAIFHASQSRKAAPPQWSSPRTIGCPSTTLPRPSGTRNIIRPMPVATPSRQGSPRRTPALAPAVVSITLLGPGVTAATTAKRRNALACSGVVPLPPGDVMHAHQARSGGEGLERSCRRPAEGWIASRGPAEGVELFSAWFAGRAYERHRHDTYAIGLTDRGVQMFDYRGSARTSLPGEVVTLYPDEPHDGRAGTRDGFGYRIVYVQPVRLSEALRVLRGKASSLPFMREPVTTDGKLSRAVARAFDAPLESLAADSIVVELAEALAATEWPVREPRIDTKAVERARHMLDAECTRTVHSR